ncbi:MAG TPA: hypothetical protein VK163_02925 [Opitutaceae bacterium]|nr:hypothetical protein [Opitutaceae bacterium]
MNRTFRLVAALLIGGAFVTTAARAVSQTVDLGGAVTSGSLASGSFVIGRLHFVVTASGGFTITQTGGRLYIAENQAAGDFRLVVTSDTGGQYGLKTIYIDQQSTGGPAGWGPYLSAAFGSTSTSIPLSSLTGSTTISFEAFGYRSGQELVIEDLENLGGVVGAMRTIIYLDNFDVDLAAAAPTVTDFLRSNPATSPTNADSLTWRLVFSEAVTGVDATDFVTSGTTATVTGITGSGTTYYVTISGGNLASLEGTATLGFAGAHSIVNSAGLNLTNLTPTGANEYYYVVSNQRPPTVTATGNNPTFTEDGSAVDLFKSVTAATNDSGQTFTSLQFSVTAVATDDVLQFGSTTIPLTNGAGGALSGIGGSYQVSIAAGTATVSVYGLSQTDAQTTALIDGMTFRNTGNNPGSTAHVVTLTAATDNGTYFNSSTLSVATTVTVVPTNDAPVLTPIAPALPAITEDETTNSGRTVVALVGASIADPDVPALVGIAITGTGGTTGTWQFSVDGGSTWTAIGAVSSSSALLLRSVDLVRCVPDTIHAGSASFSYRAWDQTGVTAGKQGTKLAAAAVGGTNPFSSGTDTASITINSAPPTTYPDWANDNFSAAELANPAIGGVDGDPDGVGLTNLLRYAFDLPARGPVSVVTTAVYDGSAATNTLTLSFPVRAKADGLSYEVQAGQDLVTWTTAATYTANGTKRQVAHAVEVPAGAQRFFLRLRVH